MQQSAAAPHAGAGGRRQDRHDVRLSSQNKAKLREALDPYIGHATKVSATGPGRRSTARSSAGVGSDAKAIRAWAAQNGVAVPARGRIPSAVVQQWKASQS